MKNDFFFLSFNENNENGSRDLGYPNRLVGGFFLFSFSKALSSKSIPETQKNTIEKKRICEQKKRKEKILFFIPFQIFSFVLFKYEMEKTQTHTKHKPIDEIKE